jgi:hypothetical protein
MTAAVKLAIGAMLPIVVFLTGSTLMSKLTDRKRVLDRLNGMEAVNERKPLGERPGYDLPAAVRYYSALDKPALESERKFLEMDLLFPFLYGGALAASLLLVWSVLGRPFSPVYLIGPVAATLFSDWTENLLQLRVLRRFVVGGEAALSGPVIRTASIATLLKLVFFVGPALMLASLVGWAIVRMWRGSVTA